MSFMETHEPGVVIHALALRMAKRCRDVICCAFREEEWIDIDFEFYQLLRAGIQEFHSASRGKLAGEVANRN